MLGLLRISEKSTWSFKERLHWLSLFSFLNGFVFIFFGSYYFIELQQNLALLVPSLTIPLPFFDKLGLYLHSYLNFFSYMLFLAFIIAFLSLPFAYFIRKKSIFIGLILIFFSIALSFFIFDLKIYQLHHFHVNWILITVMSDIATLNPSMTEISIVFLLLLSILLFEGLLVVIALKQRKNISFNVCRNSAMLASLGLAFCYITLILSMSNGNNIYAKQTTFYPLYHQIFNALTFNKKNKDNLFYFTNRRFKDSHTTAAKFHYPMSPLNCKPETLPPYNVIFILVDTLRFDALTPNQMPNLYQRKHQFTQFMDHWSGGNATKSGVFSLFYGIPPTYWQASIDAKTAPLINTKFKEAGYDLNLSISTQFTNPALIKNVFLNYTNIFTATTLDYAKPGTRRDMQATQHALLALNKKQVKPLFLNLYLDSVHSYCDQGTVETYFKPAIKHCNRVLSRDHSEQIAYYNQYRNTVRFVDTQIEKVFNTLDRKKLWDNSIVIITSDHGEEFDDNRQGYWGHTSNYTKFQLKVPLLIHWPNKKTKQINYRTSHYDVAPTLLEDALACKKQSETYSSGKNLFDDNNRKKYLLASSYTNSAIVTPLYTILFAAGSTLQTQTPKGKNIPNRPLDKDLLKQAWHEMNRFYD